MRASAVTVILVLQWYPKVAEEEDQMWGSEAVAFVTSTVLASVLQRLSQLSICPRIGAVLQRKKRITQVIFPLTLRYPLCLR